MLYDHDDQNDDLDDGHEDQNFDCDYDQFDQMTINNFNIDGVNC